jgi:hypothetical protein
MSELVVAGPPAPPPMSFRERLTQFRILEEKRCELIEVRLSSTALVVPYPVMYDIRELVRYSQPG